MYGHTQGPDGWRLADQLNKPASQPPIELLQDVLLLALSMVPESVKNEAGLALSKRHLLDLLRLPAAGQLSTQALHGLVEVALKVCLKRGQRMVSNIVLTKR
jgi:hypothetical protein